MSTGDVHYLETGNLNKLNVTLIKENFPDTGIADINWTFLNFLKQTNFLPKIKLFGIHGIKNLKQWQILTMMSIK